MGSRRSHFSVSPGIPSGVWFTGLSNAPFTAQNGPSLIGQGNSNIQATGNLAIYTANTMYFGATQVNVYGGGGSSLQISLGAASTDFIGLGSSPIGAGYVRLPAATATGAAGSATLNAAIGVVTTEVLTAAAGATTTYTISNNQVSSASRIFVSITNGSNTTKPVYATNVAPGAGSFTVDLVNAGAGALNGTIKITFWVL